MDCSLSISLFEKKIIEPIYIVGVLTTKEAEAEERVNGAESWGTEGGAQS